MKFVDFGLILLSPHKRKACPTARFVSRIDASNEACTAQKQPPDVFCKKGVLKNFASFTGKHLLKLFYKSICKTLVKLLCVYNSAKDEFLLKYFSGILSLSGYLWYFKITRFKIKTLL